ncbi:MAG: T9SS type A sorting domain-containing protein, partial [Flavobacteriales bacterium]|nr:T9SS type A sorting domain-containing protein [Flavobacteriales bacterium]
EFYTDDVGAYLSTSAPNRNDDQPLIADPQIEADDFLDNTDGWTMVRDTLIADSAYTYMTIGNFLDDLNTSVMSNPLHSGAVSTYGAYYFVDEISVQEVSTTEIPKHQISNFTAFPHLFTIQLTFNSSEVHQLRIMDVQGRVVDELQISQGSTQLDTSSWPSGIYFIQSLSNRELELIKVMKVRAD